MQRQSCDRSGRSFARVIMLVLAVASLLGGCAPEARDPLRFEEARVREPLPGTDKSVGYFEVTNTTDAQIVLVAVHSEAARAIEFHTMVQDGDMLRMRRLPEVPIPAGATVSFAPGGKHLMIFGVTGLSDPVRLVFTAADGAEYAHDFGTFTLNEAG